MTEAPIMHKHFRMPMKSLFQGAFFLLVCSHFAASAGAQTPKVKQIPATVEQLVVTDYGIYTATKTASMTNDLGLTHSTVSNIQLIEATDTIPVRPKLKFGFRYLINGAPDDAPVEIKQVTIYPSGGVNNPKKGLLHANSFSTTYRTGMSRVFAGYDVDEDWELVPGTWTIQLWIGKEKFAEQSFSLVMQQDAQDSSVPAH
jgi:hypothetical protein